MNEVRLATIGSGAIVHSILDGAARTEGIRLEAVYSRREETGRQLADRYGAQKVFTDLDALLADSQVNTVYIASPNLLHYQQTRQALLAGKHVICEKPFCTRGEQVRELAGLAKERRLFLVEAVPTTFLPNYRILQENLPKIGPLKLVLGNYTQYSARYDRLRAGEVCNVFNPAFAGGCLMDINYYNVYLTAALFGPPEAAVYRPNLFENGIDTSGIMEMDYPGFRASLAGAKDARGVSYYQIEGEQGFLYVKDGSNGLAEVRVAAGGRDETFNLQPDPDRWFYEIQGLIPLLLTGDYAGVYSRLDITRTTVEVVEQARQKAGLLFPSV